MDLDSFKNKYEKVKVEENHNSVASKPLVSVCIQTYQHVDYIKECLNSILNQKTNFEFEILLGEDNSSDGTREICIDYAIKFPNKIKLFQHNRENNIAIDGLPTGRFNFMYNLYSARGKYIALCEGDDYWTDPLKLQKQVDFLEKYQEVNLTGHYAQVIDSLGNKRHVIGKHFQNYFTHEEITYRNLRIPTASLVFRNNIEFPEWITQVYGGDRAIIYLNSLKGDLKILEFTGSIYRIHEGGVEQNFKNDKLKLPKRNIIEDFIYFKLNKRSYVKWKLYKKILWNQSYLFYWSCRKGDLKKCFRSFVSILKFAVFRKI